MIKKILFISALLTGSAMLTANATPVLSFNPSSQSVTLGTLASVDVVLSGLEDGGLDQILSAYDVSVAYDTSILSWAGGTYHGLTTFPAPVNAGGEISWNTVSFETDAALQLAQGNSFTLATILFNTLSAGTSALNFSYDDLTGLNVDPLTHIVADGSITVTAQNGSVPEPTSIALLGLGAMGLFAARRRKTA